MIKEIKSHDERFGAVKTVEEQNELAKKLFRAVGSVTKIETIMACDVEKLKDDQANNVWYRVGAASDYGSAKVFSGGGEVMDINWSKITWRHLPSTPGAATHQFTVRVKNPTLETVHKIDREARKKMRFTSNSGEYFSGESVFD